MSHEELSERVRRMEEQLSTLWAERQKKENKKEHNRVAREKQQAAKVAANEQFLKNLDTCCLVPRGKGTFRGRDRRLDAMIPKWAEKAQHLGKMNKPGLFLQWLSWQWNNNTYRAKPITSGQGYFWKFYGWESATEGKKPMRGKYTEMQLFGKTPRVTFNSVQAETFREAPWWGWGWGVLKQVVSHLDDDLEVWNDLPPHFRRVVGLMCGGYGMVELKKGLIFDQNAGTELNKTYRIAKPGLDLGWKSVLKGLKASREPTLPATAKVV